MHFVLNSPVTAYLIGQARGSRFVGSEAEGEVARAGFVLTSGFMSRMALQADQLRSVRMAGRIRLDAYPS
jgi:hypothetical protein